MMLKVITIFYPDCLYKFRLIAFAKQQQQQNKTTPIFSGFGLPLCSFPQYQRKELCIQKCLDSLTQKINEKFYQTQLKVSHTKLMVMQS